LLADEDAATLWPRGRADIPASVKTCADCREELRGYLYEDQCRGTETCAPMPAIDIKMRR